MPLNLAVDARLIRPFEKGWIRELVYRSSKATRCADVYYITPSGRKCRSMKEVQKYACNGLTVNNFTFRNEPLGLEDASKELIRNSYRLNSLDENETAVDKNKTTKSKKEKRIYSSNNIKKTKGSDVCDLKPHRKLISRGNRVQSEKTKPAQRSLKSLNNHSQRILSCEHCPYKTTKRNLFSRHLLKHGHGSLQGNPTTLSEMLSHNFPYDFKDESTSNESPNEITELYSCSYSSSIPKLVTGHSCSVGALRSKPHGCQFCDYRASRLSELRNHIYIHTCSV